jgi:hypothetical protein
VRESLVYSGGGRVICALIAVLGFALPAAAAGVLFPKPLHIVRRLEDPVAKRITTVDEYCSGNRVVTINGRKVVITDYDKQQITEIDHDRGTYSVTPFADVAAGVAKIQPQAAAKRSSWKTTPLGMKTSAAGRSIDAFTFEANGEREHRRVEVGVDRQVALSREAVEVLVGAAYPSQASEEHEQLLTAAKGRTAGRMTTNGQLASPAEYGLPSEAVLSYDADGTQFTFRNSVVRIGDEAPPPELLVIAPGSQRVESRLTRAAREMRELDFPPQP